MGIGKSEESAMATKLVELNTKNRDMTAHLESMKTKLKKLYAENVQLKCELKSDSFSKEVSQKVSKSEEKDMPGT